MMESLAVQRKRNARREKLGDLMRDARAAEGLTQEEAAEKLLFHRASLSKMEAGTQEIPVETFLAMVKLYKMELDALLKSWGYRFF